MLGVVMNTPAEPACCKAEFLSAEKCRYKNVASCHELTVSLYADS